MNYLWSCLKVPPSSGSTFCPRLSRTHTPSVGRTWGRQLESTRAPPSPFVSLYRQCIDIQLKDMLKDVYNIPSLSRKSGLIGDCSGERLRLFWEPRCVSSHRAREIDRWWGKMWQDNGTWEEWVRGQRVQIEWRSQYVFALRFRNGEKNGWLLEGCFSSATQCEMIKGTGRVWIPVTHKLMCTWVAAIARTRLNI